MKFHVAFALLAIFGAAQAGKKMDVMTFGSGYNNMYERGAELDSDDGDPHSSWAATAADIVGANTRLTEEAKNEYGMKSEALSHSAKSAQELAEEKKTEANNYHKRAQNQAVRANEAYKHSQLHKKQAQEKQLIAKEYDRKAQHHDRLSKDQDIAEMDLLRKESSERREHVNNLRRANAAATSANMYHEEAQTEYGIASEFEALARDLYNKAEHAEKEARELRDKAKKEKEVAKAQEAKGKEEEARGQEYENAFIENSKKVNQLKYYQLEFEMKGENERHQTEDARIRSKYYSLLANFNKDQAEYLFRFANMEQKDHQMYRKMALDYRQQSKILAESAGQVLKQHSFVAHSAYTKQDFPASNYHGVMY